MKSKPQKMYIWDGRRKVIGICDYKGCNKSKPQKDRVIIRIALTKNSEVQALIGKLAALGCFLAKSAEKTFPFYKKTIKGIG